MYSNTFDSEFNFSNSTPIRRVYSINFKVHTDADIVARAIEAMNMLFLNEFPGVGYIDMRPAYEKEGDMDIEAYYLHADTEFWSAFLARRVSLAPHLESVMRDAHMAMATVAA